MKKCKLNKSEIQVFNVSDWKKIERFLIFSVIEIIERSTLLHTT